MKLYCTVFCSVCYVTFILHINQFGICDLRSPAMLRSVDWLLCTDVSGQPIGPIFKGQAVQALFLECLALEDRPIGCPEISVTTNLRCVKSQKSEDLINIAAGT